MGTRRLNKHHYVATQPGSTDSPTPVHLTSRPYIDDEIDSQRAPSERTLSEYTVPYSVINERDRRYPNGNNGMSYQNGRNNAHQTSSRAPSAMSRGGASNYDDNNSDIYVTSGAYRAPSEFSRSSRTPGANGSQYSYRDGVGGTRTAPSVVSSHKSRGSRKAGMMIETMAAPNPICPNIKGMCCLMLLLNLGIILVTLGFVIVIQFFEPVYVWILGIVFLIFGFLTLIGSLIYCVVVCRDVKHPDDVNPDDIYWTHHWQKHIGSQQARPPSEIHYSKPTNIDKEHDRYSDRYPPSKLSNGNNNYGMVHNSDRY